MIDSGLVIVDKPAGMTSHDVVARIRRLAATRRVGHAGTLDPMATGVLVIGIEKATRLLGHLALTQKEYAATIRLGQSTTTDDADGEIRPATSGASRSACGLSEVTLHAALAALTGEIQQVPPGISAIKVNGKRAYHLTRAGAAPELAARTVTVSRLDLLAIRPAGDLLDIDVEVTCSSGTYIRAIARDLGTALLTGGHLTALRRTRVGPYQISAAWTLDQLASSFEFIPLADAAASAFERRDLTAEEVRLVSHGARLPARGVPAAAAGSAGSAGAAAGGAAAGGAAAGSVVVGVAPLGSAAVASVAAGGPAVGRAVLGGADLEADGPDVVACGAPDPDPADRHAGDLDVAASGAPDPHAVELRRSGSLARGGPGVAGRVSSGPVAAFGPDGALIALLTEEDGQVRSLAVFVP